MDGSPGTVKGPHTARDAWKTGQKLGVMPVPRHAITLAFAGPDRKTLYVGALGGVDPDGKPWETPKELFDYLLQKAEIDYQQLFRARLVQ